MLEIIAEYATTGLAHAVDLPEAAARDATTGLAHTVDLQDTMAQDMAAPQRAIAWPGSASKKIQSMGRSRPEPSAGF